MEGARRNRQFTLLIGIGLMLVGLLAGIFGMLVFADLRPAPAAPPQPVERVELGRKSPARPEPVSDLEVPPGAVEPVTLNKLFKRVADQVTPAVVYIQVESASTREVPNDWFHNFDDETRRRFFRDNPLRQSVGSGVIVSGDGYVVTNNHVVENAQSITVTLFDKRVYSARVTGLDPSTDLAVIRLEEAENLPVVEIGDSDEVEVGEWVLAVGNPFRLTSTVTAGIVSALGRQVNIIEGSFRIEDFIQTDAAINPGNSGGALVNLKGQLVGIATAIATESGSYEGYGFAVPVNLVERVASDLIAHGEVQRGFLGVSIQDVDAGSAKRLGLERIGGVLVDDVRSGGAADRGGMKDGDVVLAIGGRAINATNELQSVVARHRPGDQLAVDVWRSGQIYQLQVTLLGREAPAYRSWFADLNRDEMAPRMPDLQPEAPVEPPQGEIFDLEDWGMGLRDLSDRERDAFEVQTGAYIAFIEGGSLAASGGLPRDVVIEQIAGQDVLSTADALALLGDVAQTEESVLLRVRRRDGLAAFYELDVPGPRG